MLDLEAIKERLVLCRDSGQKCQLATDIPALIAEVEHQRRQIEALKAEVANGIVDERRACAALAELYAQACPLCHKGAAAIRARGDNA